MPQNSEIIRIATDQDRDAILSVHQNAFGGEGAVIVELVNAMLDDPSSEPLLSLVAETDTGLAGHVLFTSARIEPDQGHVKARILAPLAVVPGRQRQGLGGALIRAGLTQLRESSVNLVFVLGYPDYYTRFGFRPAGVQGLQATYPIPPENADAWMVTVLKPVENCSGTLRCSNALDDPKYWIE